MAETKVGSTAPLIPCNHVPRLHHVNILSGSPSGPDVDVAGVSLHGEDPVIIWPTPEAAGLILFVSN